MINKMNDTPLVWDKCIQQSREDTSHYFIAPLACNLYPTLLECLPNDKIVFFLFCLWGEVSWVDRRFLYGRVTWYILKFLILSIFSVPLDFSYLHCIWVISSGLLILSLGLFHVLFTQDDSLESWISVIIFFRSWFVVKLAWLFLIASWALARVWFFILWRF